MQGLMAHLNFMVNVMTEKTGKLAFRTPKYSVLRVMAVTWHRTVIRKHGQNLVNGLAQVVDECRMAFPKCVPEEDVTLIKKLIESITDISAQLGPARREHQAQRVRADRSTFLHLLNSPTKHDLLLPELKASSTLSPSNLPRPRPESFQQFLYIKYPKPNQAGKPSTASRSNLQLPSLLIRLIFKYPSRHPEHFQYIHIISSFIFQYQ